MSVTAEIDKAGRLVVPKKLRDALHLVPGSRLTFEQQGETIVLRQESTHRGLFLKNGILVHDSGLPPSQDIKNWLDRDREDRMQAILGDAIKL